MMMKQITSLLCSILIISTNVRAILNSTITTKQQDYVDTESLSFQHQTKFQHVKESQQNVRRRTSTKGFNILTLGGSVTWGSQLEDRSQAYPHLLSSLGPHTVRNRSMRATGSFYPAVCLQSMMEGDDTNYDVVILEFTINGVRAFDWLVKRIRARYPNAIIIYVHLYSLRFNIIDAFGKTPYDHGIYSDFSHRTEYSWFFKPIETRQKVPPQVRDIPRDWEMYSYFLPFPRFPAEAEEWFSADWHHLSKVGHEKIARELLDMLDAIAITHPPGVLPPVEGTWGLGDTCQNWFGDGQTDLAYLNGEMKPMQRYRVFLGKYAIEFKGGEKGGIMIPNSKQRAPMWMHFVSTGRIYPRARVRVGANEEEVIIDHDANADIIGEKVDTKMIGWAETTDNFITIEPELGYQEPFRLVAIGFCGACYEEVIGQPRLRPNELQ